jgi:hypothetical protein
LIGSSFLAQLTLCGLFPSTIHFHISIFFCKTAKLNGTKLGRNIHFLDEVDLQGEGLIGGMKREFK